MADGSVRDLERRAGEEPGDWTQRLRLCSELARAGRRGEALAKLDLSRVPAEWFRDAKKLSDELWCEEVSRFKPRLSERAIGAAADFLAFDPESQWLAWVDSGVLHATSLAFPEVKLFEGRLPLPHTVLAARGCAFVGYAPGIARNYVPERTPAAGEVRFFGRGFVLESVAPTADRLLVRDSFPQWRVIEWPSLANLVDSPDQFVAVDWDREVLVSRTGTRQFDGRRVTGPRPIHAIHALGNGVIAELGQGLKLHAIDGGWTTTVVEDRSGATPKPSLSLDGRSVRVFVQGRPRRFDVDLKTGELREEKCGDRLSPSTLAAAGWHSIADLVALEGKVLALDGSTVLELPAGSRPAAWAPDGRSLAVIADEGKRLELWRAPQSGT